MVRSIVACVLLAACAPAESEGSAVDAQVSNVTYVGAVNDESLLNLIALEPRQEPSRLLAIQSPAPAGEYPVAAGLTFSFTGPVALAPSAPAHGPAQGPGWNTFGSVEALRRSLADLAAQLAPIRSAYAHGPPFNGRGYYLRVSDSAGALPLEVFTDAMSYVVPPVQLTALAQAEQPLRLTITWGDFDQDLLGPSTGPFAGGAVDFTVR